MGRTLLNMSMRSSDTVEEKKRRSTIKENVILAIPFPCRSVMTLDLARCFAAKRILCSKYLE